MVTIIIPALNESATIGQVIAYCRKEKLVSEVIVVDDNSVDNTVEIAEIAGARVIGSKVKGKGSSMRDGLHQASNEFVVYIDADIDPYPPGMIQALVKPLLENEADFVKATFSRNAGRVTELVAKPLLSIMFPELAIYSQPLSGMIAGKKSMLNRVEFLNDYGVDIGILIDMFLMHARIREVNIGYIENKSKPWQQLGKMSSEVANAIITRALQHNKPNFNLEELETISVISKEMDSVLKNKANSLQKMAVFDMDNTLLQGRFIDTFAGKFGFSDQLNKLRTTEKDPAILTKRIAALLKGRTMGELLETAAGIPLVPDTEEVIRELKERGYLVGIISDSYQVVVNYIKGKIGADFGLANQLEFIGGKATGEITIPSFFYNGPHSVCDHKVCKSNALVYISGQHKLPLGNVISIGDSENDRCLLEKSGIGVAYCSGDDLLRNLADKVIARPGFTPILEFAD